MEKDFWKKKEIMEKFWKKHTGYTKHTNAVGGHYGTS